jgi:glutathione S-transferase
MDRSRILVKLYGLSRSVYTRIARLVLEEKGIDYELSEVEIFGDQGVPPEHFHRHPFGRIPVLEHDGFMLYETSAITRYIDEAFPGPSLQPPSAAGRARMNQIIGLLDAYAYRPMIWEIFVQRVPVVRQGGLPDEQAIAAALPVADRCIATLESFLGEQPFFTGDALSLADLHAAPMLSYFATTPEGQRSLASRPHLTRWRAAIQHRPSFQSTRSIFD